MYFIQPGVGRLSGESREEERIITSLRLGHTELNSTMHLIVKHSTEPCEMSVNESFEHVIMQCNEYTRERNHLDPEVGGRPNETSLKLQYLGITAINVEGE